jgi:hypothetical protein
MRFGICTPQKLNQNVLNNIKFEHLFINSAVHENESLNITGLAVNIVQLTSIEPAQTISGLENTLFQSCEYHFCE